VPCLVETFLPVRVARTELSVSVACLIMFHTPKFLGQDNGVTKLNETVRIPVS